MQRHLSKTNPTKKPLISIFPLCTSPSQAAAPTPLPSPLPEGDRGIWVVLTPLYSDPAFKQELCGDKQRDF